jgi:hypothetical protein
LDDIWKRFAPDRDEFIETLFSRGPAGLLEKAVELGYRKMPGYATKCHLCTSLRSFLLQKGLEKQTVGPDQCY